MAVYACRVETNGCRQVAVPHRVPLVFDINAIEMPMQEISYAELEFRGTEIWASFRIPAISQDELSRIPEEHIRAVALLTDRTTLYPTPDSPQWIAALRVQISAARERYARST